MPRIVRSRVKLKVPSVRNKDLTETGAWGWATPSDFDIEIEKKLSQRNYLETLLHEIFHCVLPDLSEHCVEKMCVIFANEIWKKGFRRKKKKKI